MDEGTERKEDRQKAREGMRDKERPKKANSEGEMPLERQQRGNDHR